MLTAGVATWLITTLGPVRSGTAASDLRLASLALLAGGVTCGAGNGVRRWPARAAPGPAARAGPAGAPGSLPGVPESAGPAPSLAGPRSLMNPPPPDPPPLDPPSGDTTRRGPGLVARRAQSGQRLGDTPEEWLRSLRGPAVQQPPPHSAE